MVGALGVLLALSASAAADEAKDYWHEKTDVDKITDRKTVYLFRVADGHLLKFSNIVGGQFPRLILGCQEQRRFFSVELTTPAQLDLAGNAQVITRHGKFNPTTLPWRAGSGSDRTLLVLDRHAINFAAGLTLVDKFLLRYQSKEGPSVTLEFATFGIKDHLPRIARACGWDYERAIREVH